MHSCKLHSELHTSCNLVHLKTWIVQVKHSNKESSTHSDLIICLWGNCIMYSRSLGVLPPFPCVKYWYSTWLGLHTFEAYRALSALEQSTWEIAHTEINMTWINEVMDDTTGGKSSKKRNWIFHWERERQSTSPVRLTSPSIC